MELPLWLTIPAATVLWFEVLGRLANVVAALIAGRQRPRRLV